MDPTELPLRPLHLPDPIGWWPLAPGWWFVIALLLAGIGWLVLRAWQKYQFLAPQRCAMRTLAEVESDYLTRRDPLMLGRQLSELLRRSMLAYAPRHEVAGLTGDAWLEWLDRDLPVPYFHTEGGKSLLQLPYRDPNGDFSDVDINALLAAVRMRLATPVGSAV
ncbi:MAG: DUF4381 domain-containing protein [Woeseiaceae bacterium]|jgi:hypothetical protein|nr:DUF4381 domain-containing protein [Woeseiaceae bacterium]